MPPLTGRNGLFVGVYRVDFANPKGFYYPGEKIVGTLFIRLDKVMRYKQLMLIYKGESKAEYYTYVDTNSRAWLENHEIYFDHHEILLESQTPDESIYPGEIRHPFEFQLPNDLPPNATFRLVTTESGFIMYNMQLIMLRTIRKKGNETIGKITLATINIQVSIEGVHVGAAKEGED